MKKQNDQGTNLMLDFSVTVKELVMLSKLRRRRSPVLADLARKSTAFLILHFKNVLKHPPKYQFLSLDFFSANHNFF